EIGVDGEEIVSGAGDERELLEAAVGDGALDDERTVQRVDRALLGLELDLPEQLQILDAVLGDLRFVLLPAGPLEVAAVRNPVRRPDRNHAKTGQEQGPDADSAHSHPLVRRTIAR